MVRALMKAEALNYTISPNMFTLKKACVAKAESLKAHQGKLNAR